MKLPKPIDELYIVNYPDPVLRKKCTPVETFDNELEALAQRMIQLMHHAGGLGLAAPQVGVTVRMFISNSGQEGEDDHVWVNPVLSDLQSTVEAEEGCLSIPEVSIPKRRAVHAIIDAFDLTGKRIKAHGSDLVARVWQHEIDHLNGVLVIDHMPASVELANRRTLRDLEADYEDEQRRRKDHRKR